MKPSVPAVILLLTVFTSTSAADVPNIVLVMVDDQGWGDMAYNGHPTLKTPNFDAAAAAGLRFDRFYASAPVCSPTRASVMTGRHPNRMGVFKWGYPIRPQETTIAEALRTAGYVTGHFGKWHLGSVRNTSPAHPGNNGFDEWLSAPNFFDNDAILSHKGKAVQTQGESSMVTVDAALGWISKVAKGGQPFLAVVWFGTPHGPHRAIKQDLAPYENQPANRKHFYGEITGMDRAFGKLRNALDDFVIRENTLLWYSSDNGALPRVGSTGGFRGQKGKVYEGGLLVPAILEWSSKITKPRTMKVRCNSSDIYPTLLEIAGVATANQPRLDGISLAGLIDGTVESACRPPIGWPSCSKHKKQEVIWSLTKQAGGPPNSPSLVIRSAITLDTPLGSTVTGNSIGLPTTRVTLLGNSTTSPRIPLRKTISLNRRENAWFDCATT